MQIQRQETRNSRYNTIAQPTLPMDVSEQVLMQLAQLSLQPRWIMFTHQTPRPDLTQLSSNAVRCQKVIQIKPSQYQSEVEIVTKAILSGNASAIVASNQIDSMNQALLSSLALDHQCQVFFVDPRAPYYH